MKGAQSRPRVGTSGRLTLSFAVSPQAAGARNVRPPPRARTNAALCRTDLRPAALGKITRQGRPTPADGRNPAGLHPSQHPIFSAKKKTFGHTFVSFDALFAPGPTEILSRCAVGPASGRRAASMRPGGARPASERGSAPESLSPETWRDSRFTSGTEGTPCRRPPDRPLGAPLTAFGKANEIFTAAAPAAAQKNSRRAAVSGNL